MARVFSSSDRATPMNVIHVLIVTPARVVSLEARMEDPRCVVCNGKALAGVSPPVREIRGRTSLYHTVMA